MNKNLNKKRFVKSNIIICLISSLLILAFSLQPMQSFNTKAEYDYYKTEYSTREQIAKAGNELNKKIVEEGAVLLKNKDNTLPLATSNQVTLFGRNAARTLKGGGGSSSTGAIDTSVPGNQFIDLVDSIKNAGYSINQTAYDWFLSAYNDGWNYQDGYGQEMLPTKIPENIKETFNKNQTAIICIKRSGCEGADVRRSEGVELGTVKEGLTDTFRTGGALNAGDHKLQLDKAELDMINYANNTFGKVILILNTGNPIELGFLDDESAYKRSRNINESYNLNVDAAILMGFPGQQGADAIGEILKGTVNPSGRLADIYPRDFTKDPTWQNFNTNRSTQVLNSVFYQEDIYYGYKYWETRGYEEEKVDSNSTWYSDNVVYPFGYGLSYTNFSYELFSKSPDDEVMKDDTKFEIKIKVTNTGTVKGKDVVQAYYTAPYNDDALIEKSYVNLVDFVKTKELNPNESEIVTLSFDARDMKSYDWSDINNNGFKGYELEKGDYKIRIAENSHNYPITLNYNLQESCKYENDEVTGTKIENLYDDVSENEMGVTQNGGKYMSRKDFTSTFPTPLESKTVQQTEISYNINEEDDKKYDFYVENKEENIPVYSQEAGTSITNEVKLYQLIGRSYDDPLWDDMMNQLTLKEMAHLIGAGSFRTEKLESIMKPETVEGDGPVGWVQQGQNHVNALLRYASTIVLAQTFNKDIAKEYGEMIGDEALVGNSGYIYSGMYAPGLNLHRSQFGGRNFEYMSEDAVLCGTMAAQQVKAMRGKGVYAMIKHFMLNDQESSRENINTWASEQNIRENYAKAFEIVVKKGKAFSMMTGYNNIGNLPNVMSYRNNVKLLRNEWGFKGAIITDWNQASFVPGKVDSAIRGGVDLVMSNANFTVSEPSININTATQINLLRQSAKNVLYMVANSNAMNGVGGPTLLAYYESKVFNCLEDENINISLAYAKGFNRYDAKFNYEVVGNLPEGLSLSSDGILSGKINMTKGDYDINIKAIEDTSAEFKYESEVTKITLKVLSKNTPEGIIYNSPEEPYQLILSKYCEVNLAGSLVADGKVSYDLDYSIKEGSELPGGLTLSENGCIKGIPTSGEGLTNTQIVIKSKDGSFEKEITMPFNILVKYIDYQGEKLDEVYVGSAVKYDLGTAFGKNGEKIKISYGLKDGSLLPEGLKIDAQGIVTGTVKKGYKDYQFTIIAFSSEANSVEANFIINVLGISSNDVEYLADIDKNMVFDLNKSVCLNDNDKKTDFYYEIIDGSLLTGYTLLSNGEIIGKSDVFGETCEATIKVSARNYESVEMKIKMENQEVYYDSLDNGVEKGETENTIDPIDINKENDTKARNNIILYVSLPCGLVILIAVSTIVIIKIKKKKNN